METIEGYEIQKTTLFETGHGFALGCAKGSPEKSAVWDFTETAFGRDYYRGNYTDSREAVEQIYRVRVRRKKDGTKAHYEAYMCGSHSRHSHMACTTHYIPQSVLSELVLSDIQARADEVCCREEEVIRRMTEQMQEQNRTGQAGERRHGEIGKGTEKAALRT